MDFLRDLFEHPSVVVGTAALAVTYAGASCALKRWPRPRQLSAFSAALIVILIAHGPIDELADRRLFFVHMFQHFLQTLVIPPLLLLGVPDWMLRPWVMSRALKPLARLLTRPLVAFSLFSAVLITVHNPPIFDRMCRDESFHIAIHLLFMTSGVILWWPLLSPLAEIPRLPYPAQIMYLFVLMIPMAAVAAPITLATQIVYPWYRVEPHPWGLTAHADQVLGGLLMWVGQGLYIMCIFSMIFFRWAAREDRDFPMAAAHPPPLDLLKTRSI
jgi:putative membrane protein